MPPLHPLIIHFPIVLFTLAVFFDFITFYRTRHISRDKDQTMQQEINRFGPATKITMILGFVSTLIAVATGEWLKVQLGISHSPKVNDHQALAIIFTIWYAGLLFLRLRHHWTPSKLYISLACIGVLIMVILGHTGGSMVWAD